MRLPLLVRYVRRIKIPSLRLPRIYDSLRGPRSQIYQLFTHIMHRQDVTTHHIPCLTSHRLICLISIIICALSHSSPVHPIDSPRVALSAANLNGSAPVHCTSRSEWIGSGYVEQHCYRALDTFYDREALVYKEERFEWLPRGQRPVGRDIVWTPKAYVVGT